MIENAETKKKTVRFQPENKLVRLFRVLEKQDTWLTAEECKGFKEQARRTAKACKKFGYGAILEHTFNNPKPVIMQHLINDYVKQAGYSQRGLERWINSQHARDRAQNKAECIQKVLTFQKKMKRRKVSVNVVERELATVSMSLSRHAKVFARRVGKADALSALEQHSSHHSVACEMTRKRQRESEQERKMVQYKVERSRKLGRKSRVERLAVVTSDQ